MNKLEIIVDKDGNVTVNGKKSRKGRGKET